MRRCLHTAVKTKIESKQTSHSRVVTIKQTIQRATSFPEQVFWFCQAPEPHLHNT
jgi:hypothetical protein